MPRLINGLKFYSIPEAAKEAGVTRNTMFRWVKKEVDEKTTNHIIKDLKSGHYLIDEEFVTEVSNRWIYVTSAQPVT